MPRQPAMRDTGKNRKVALTFAAVAAAMVGLVYASVPLYALFCQVTGFGGTPQRAEAAPAKAIERMMTVRFDANIAGSLPWVFEPAQRAVLVKVGRETFAYYRATNTSDRDMAGTAVFNVSPDAAGAYFNKIECFCFTRQTLKAGQSVEMPVSFFIDPAIVEDPDLAKLTTITLSYTFYPAGEPGNVSAAPDAKTDTNLN